MIKADCRKMFIAKRKELSLAEKELFSTQIIQQIVQNFDLKDKTISVFLPIERMNEINTYPLLELKEELNIRFGLPVVQKESVTIQHYEYVNKEKISISSFGIPEPQGGSVIEPSEFDLVVVPLLCVDKKGYRVGYGKGYYDHFLAACKKECLFVGVSYFEPIELIEDIFEGDIPLSACVTSKNTIYFNQI
jgi:5-formyltetrahydrofolate cyclo-ligase